MNIFTNIIVVVCMLVSGAHFYRQGAPVTAVLLAILPLLLILRKRWVYVTLAVILALLSIEWIMTGYNIYSMRLTMGMPYMRMLIIMLSVAGVNIAGSILLARKKVKQIE